MYSTAYRKVRQLPTAARGPSTAHRRPGVRPLLTEKAFICPQEKRLLFAYNSGPLHCPQRLPDRPRWSKNLPTVRRLPTAANHFVPASAHSPLSAHSGNGMWAGSAYYGNCPNACLQVWPDLLTAETIPTHAYKFVQSLLTTNLHVSAGRTCSQRTLSQLVLPTCDTLTLGPRTTRTCWQAGS
jgi:hypothetical protein